MKKIKLLFNNKIFLIFLFILFYLILYYDLYTCNLVSADEGYQLALNSWSFSKIIYYCSVDYHVPLFAFLVKIFSFLPISFIHSARILLSLIIIFHFFIAFYPVERLFGRKVSLIYSIIFLLSPLMFYFAVNIRMFSLANLCLFCVIIYTLLYYKYGKKSDLIKLTIVSILGCYSFILVGCISFFVIFGMLLYCWFTKQRDKCRGFTVCFSLTLFSFGPWIPILLRQTANVVSDRYWKYFPNNFIKFFVDVTNIFIMRFNGDYSVSGYVWACLLVLILLIGLVFLFKIKKVKTFDLHFLNLVVLLSFLFIMLYCYINQAFAFRYFVIIYSTMILMIIYFLVSCKSSFSLPILLVFGLMFYFNYTNIIFNDNLGDNNNASDIIDTIENDSQNNEKYIFHYFEASLEIFYKDLNKYNNYVVYDINCDKFQKNILRDYTIFEKNVYVLDDIMDIHKYTDVFYMILLKKRYENNVKPCIFDTLNDNKWDYELLGDYYSNYNRDVYYLYKIKIR